MSDAPTARPRSARSPRPAALAAALAALATLAAAPLHAQHQLEPVNVVARNAAKANAIHEAALAASSDPRHYRSVAFMHLHSADLRERSDAQGATCLTLAGNLLYFSGDLAEAQEAFEDAGGRAEARGDAATSANAYIDAAVTARARRDGGVAEELGARAERLARSPSLTPEQRAGILSRIERVGEVRTADAAAAELRAAMRAP
jgi:hypothetical protein